MAEGHFTNAKERPFGPKASTTTLLNPRVSLNFLKEKERGLQSRWQQRRTQSLHLPTTRAPARCWWGTSTPKEMGQTPKRPGRTWGDRGGRKSVGRTGPVPLRGGWEVGGFLTPRRTLSRGLEDQGERAYHFPRPVSPRKPAGLPGRVLRPPRPRSGPRWS